MRQPIVVGNWKMHKTISEGIRLVTELKGLLSGKRETQVVIAPPFTALNSLSIALQSSHIKLGAQNVHYASHGAYTGEVSVSMLTDIGVEYIIIGHSERRQYFGESNDTVNKKLKAVVEENLIPVLCIGETQQERDGGKTKDVLTVQLHEGFKGLRVQALEHLIVAYEPVWAIGTGNNATADQADEAHQHIRTTVGEIYGSIFSNALRILYGGSVTAENVASFADKENIDGVLVGGASLSSETFLKIVTSFD